MVADSNDLTEFRLTQVETDTKEIQRDMSALKESTQTAFETVALSTLSLSKNMESLSETVGKHVAQDAEEFKTVHGRISKITDKISNANPLTIAGASTVGGGSVVLAVLKGLEWI